MTFCGFHDWAAQTLGGIGLLAGVGVETVMELGGRARWKRCAPGDVLVAEGELCTSFHALVEGSAKVWFTDRRPSVNAEAGETLGLRVAFYDGPSWVTIRAVTPALVAQVDLADLTHFMATSPALASNVSRMLSARMRHLKPCEQLDTQILKALAQAVDGTAARSGEVPLSPPINPALWATLMGVDRSDVERALVRLERHRIVRSATGGRRFVDLERLRARLS